MMLAWLCINQLFNSNLMQSPDFLICFRDLLEWLLKLRNVVPFGFRT